jgi:diaminohydroxyphosphoribosylaminopyrimidine deaminase/5-amino-6-(5-phosphoribosylamino)uracil reductase
VAASGLSRVVFGLVDPNPRVNGSGAALLRAKGVEAELDLSWEPECARLAETFAWNVRKQTPFVGLKAATSLDGMIARPGDQRAWITGPRARAYGHFLRLWYDAVIVGQGTVMADDPRLDARDALLPPEVPARTPLRVVLDPDGAALTRASTKLPRMLAKDPAQVLWLTGEELEGAAAAGGERVAAAGAKVQTLTAAADGLFPPAAVLAALQALGVTSVLLEGGAGLYGSFLAAGAVQRLHLFQAATLLGAGGTSLTSGLSAQGAAAILPSPAAGAQLTPLGADWLIELRVGDAS